jgi:hypothetical protein
VSCGFFAAAVLVLYCIHLVWDGIHLTDAVADGWLNGTCTYCTPGILP